MNTKFLVDQLTSVKTEQLAQFMCDDVVERALSFAKRVKQFDATLWAQNELQGFPFTGAEVFRMAVVSALSDTSMDDTRL